MLTISPKENFVNICFLSNKIKFICSSRFSHFIFFSENVSSGLKKQMTLFRLPKEVRCSNRLNVGFKCPLAVFSGKLS